MGVQKQSAKLEFLLTLSRYLVVNKTKVPPRQKRRKNLSDISARQSCAKYQIQNFNFVFCTSSLTRNGLTNLSRRRCKREEYSVEDSPE